jgi:hypothetical protein
MTVFIHGKMKRVRRPPVIEGMGVDDFLRQNADPIFLHQERMWEYLQPADDICRRRFTPVEVKMLRIIASDLLLALSDRSYETTYYLDRETGAVIPTFGDLFEPGDPEFIDEEPLMDDTRYIAIEPLASHEAFGWMEQFAADVEDGELQRLLRRALVRHRPFRGFKDVLAEYPAERQAWFQFEEERQLQAARDWLASEGVEAEFISLAEAAPNTPPRQEGSSA